MKHFSTQRLSGVFIFFSVALFLFFTSAASALESNNQATWGKFNRFFNVLLMNQAEISIEKEALTPVIEEGDRARFKITVFNSGTVDIFDISVTDELVASCGDNFNRIRPDQFESYQCQSAPLMNNMTNTAEVFGKYGSTATFPVNDSDQAMVEVVAPQTNPSIKINKTTSTPTLFTGQTAVFNIAVTNDGDVALNDIVIDDPLASDCDEEFDTLAVDQTESYQCELANINESFTNVASVTANDGASEVADSSSASVTEIELGITIEKTAVTPSIGSGDTAEFIIQIQNISDVQLFNVIVEDELTPDCDANYSTLLPNAIRTYACELPSVTESFTNEATVTGRTGDFIFVDASDTAEVEVSGTYDISLTKTASPSAIGIGEIANFDFVIKNTGSLPLENVSMNDPDAPICNEPNLGDLDAGETIEFSCQIAGLVTNLTNTAVVKADTGSGNEVSDSSTDTIVVNNPAVSISVDPSSQTIDFGNAAAFDVTIENTGNRLLTSVSVTSSSVPDCTRNVANIAFNSSRSFTCIASNVQDDFVNDLTVTATGANQQVSDSTSAIVQVENNSNIVVAISPSLQTLLLGDNNNDDAEFTIFIFNNGTATLNNLEVTSALVPSCNRTLSVMPPQFVVDFECEAPNVTSAFINTLVVSATPEGSNTPIENTGLAIVDVAGIDISIIPDTNQMASPGGLVSFNATIDNVGSTDVLLQSITGAFINSQTDPVNAPLVNSNCQENLSILAGQTYVCSFEIDVSGSSGDYDVEIKANVTSSGLNFSNTAVETINIAPPPETIIFLPMIIRDRPEEPNDVCTEALPINTDIQYQFLPDDKNDLFTFDLTQTSNLEIRLTNFTPQAGQIVLYRGDCSAPVVVANNGNVSASKTISVQNQPAGTYIILIVNDGALSTTPYNLIVDTN